MSSSRMQIDYHLGKGDWRSVANVEISHRSKDYQLFELRAYARMSIGNLTDAFNDLIKSMNLDGNPGADFNWFKKKHPHEFSRLIKEQPSEVVSKIMSLNIQI